MVNIRKERAWERRCVPRTSKCVFFWVSLAVIFFLLLFAGIGAVTATTYYVNNNWLGASDSNSGLADTNTTAWKTIDHGLSTVTAGDTVIIRGGPYNEAATLDHSGTAGNIIQIIGEGNPIMDSSNTKNNAFYADNKDYFTIKGFTIKNYRESAFRIDSYSSLDYITLSDNVMDNIGEKCFNLDFYGGSFPGWNYLTISNNTITNSGNGWPSHAFFIVGGYNVLVRNNTVDNFDGVGIEFGSPGTKNNTVENNIFTNITEHAIWGVGNNHIVRSNTISTNTRGVVFDAPGSNCQVVNNEILLKGTNTQALIEIYEGNDYFYIGNNTGHTTNPRTGAFRDIRMKGNHHIIENNKLYDGCWYEVAVGSNVTFRYNFIEDGHIAIGISTSSIKIDNNIIIDPDNYGIWVTASGSSLTINNNVFYSSSYDAIMVGASYSSVSIKNNIFSEITGYCVNRGAGSLTVSYNDVWNCGSPAFSGVTATNTLQQNPQFADASNYDFHLKSQGGRWTPTDWVIDSVTSPCIDAGDPSSDYSKEPAPNGGRINMGAYGNSAEASKSRGSDITPPTSITHLQNTTGQTWINWTWFNPTDSDFNYTMVYIEGVWQTNTSEPSYNATSLTLGTTYEIGTRTVDRVGNINMTWVNQTTRTGTLPDKAPPASITSLNAAEIGQTRINWTWKDPVDPDFSHVMIYLDGAFEANVSKSKGYYYASRLSAGTSYTIGTHTVDTIGNINDTWINNTSKTAIGGGTGGTAASALPSGVIEVSTTPDGKVISPVTAHSSDGKASITIYTGTIAKDAAGNPLKEVMVTIPSALPAGVPSGVEYIGYAIQLGPEGATFSQPVEISITFDPADFKGKTPVIYVYDADAWTALETTIIGNRATTKVDHFSTFVLFAAPKVTPTPTITITPVISPALTPIPIATPTPNPKSRIPGFEAVFTIAGLLAVKYLMLKRKRLGKASKNIRIKK